MHRHGETLLRALAISAVLLLSGCVGTLSGQLTIPHETASRSIYFVERSPQDGRDLASTIVARMRARGLNAVTGASVPANADYVISYIDKWQWDMRMYLFDLRIEMRDTKNASLVGYGESSQSSLKAMGKTFADIIDSALNQLYGK